MKNYKDLLIKAQNLWGDNFQLNQTQEECAELIVAINKWRRQQATLIDLIDECVDVELMIEQMKIILAGHEQTWEMIKDTKLKRLKRLINQAG